ncbi:hypothetical protein VA596_28555 [Amycolatopsis sp., V23-08]|uniref:Uncharacterized protein n=1 Tax=Amycolatopsis heterodermiae TaxID=3110235 RepID=A0ABU5RBI8_9PSEU|nr:hypothetical protein [Amycolatopsis sp., V23-08]MEA5363513.1 hypothetical protein [Amycolatopsis sp., V23-08]
MREHHGVVAVLVRAVVEGATAGDQPQGRLPKKSDGWDLDTDDFADCSGKSPVSPDDL